MPPTPGSVLLSIRPNLQMVTTPKKSEYLSRRVTLRCLVLPAKSSRTLYFRYYHRSTERNEKPAVFNAAIDCKRQASVFVVAGLRFAACGAFAQRIGSNLWHAYGLWDVPVRRARDRLDRSCRSCKFDIDCHLRYRAASNHIQRRSESRKHRRRLFLPIVVRWWSAAAHVEYGYRCSPGRTDSGDRLRDYLRQAHASRDF